MYIGRRRAVKADANARGTTWGAAIDHLLTLSGSNEDGSNSGFGGPCLLNCSSAIRDGFLTFHSSGCYFLMADGGVRFVNESTEVSVLAGLMTRANSDPPPTY